VWKENSWLTMGLPTPKNILYQTCERCHASRWKQDYHNWQDGRPEKLIESMIYGKKEKYKKPDVIVEEIEINHIPSGPPPSDPLEGETWSTGENIFQVQKGRIVKFPRQLVIDALKADKTVVRGLTAEETGTYEP